MLLDAKMPQEPGFSMCLAIFRSQALVSQRLNVLPRAHCFFCRTVNYKLTVPDSLIHDLPIALDVSLE